MNANTVAPLLGSYVVKQCPKRVALDFDPTVDIVKDEPTPSQQDRMDAGIDFEEAIHCLLRASHPNMVEIPAQAKASKRFALKREELTLEAMEAGAEIIWNPRLPRDEEGRRVGEPDLLLRGPKRNDGKWSYRPIDVKWHAARSLKGSHTVNVSNLDKPKFAHARVANKVGLGVIGDELQLAHYVRMLEACGHGQPQDGAIGGIIGKDSVLWWTDLNKKNRKASHSTKASVMEIYDIEFAIRVDIVDRACNRKPGDPEIVALCTHWSVCKTNCPYRTYKGEELRKADALTLLTGVSQAQVEKLAENNIFTRTQLANLSVADIADLETQAGLKNLAWHVVSAQAATAGAPLLRKNFVPLVKDSEHYWIDIDMENDTETGIVYMWGVRTKDEGYNAFVDWTEDDDGEREVFVAFWKWLMDKLTLENSVAYCYTSAEERCLRFLATKHAGMEGVPTLEDIDNLVNSSQWFDLYDYVKTIAWPTESLSIKYVAKECGFSWRDNSPSGEESALWYREAKTMGTRGRAKRAAARDRLLKYNEDDVRAMEAIRNLHPVPQPA